MKEGHSKEKVKYHHIGDKSSRSDINQVENEGPFLNDHNVKKKRKTHKKGFVEEQKKITYIKPQIINKGKPAYLEVKPYILQSPGLQLFGQVNNFAVCPFCKYTGTMDIEYQRSHYQKSCCCFLATIGLFLCCWIPLIIRALADQVYKCTNCKRTLKIVRHDDI